MNQSGINIDDIYIHDGSYWHVNGALSDIFPGTSVKNHESDPSITGRKIGSIL